MTHAPKPPGLFKPSIDTKYRIDYSWWERSDEDLHSYLLSHVSPEQREQLAHASSDDVADYIDPETGEVFRVDRLGLAIQMAAKSPDFVSPQTPLVDSIFRVFLANGNQPLSPHELEERIGRPSSLILKTLSGARIYKGIRPIQG